MPTTIQFITAVLHAEVTEPLGRGIKIAENLFLSNDPAIPKRLLDKEVVDVIGKLEYEQIIGSGLYIYGEWPDDRNYTTYDHMVILRDQIYAVQGFLLLLWMLKDNAAELELSFLIERIPFLPARISSNMLTHGISRHDLLNTVGIFQKTELLSAQDRFGKHFHGIASQGPETQIEVAKRQGRIGRAFQFVLAARATTFTFLKVTNYCSALESLFCSDSQEIAHKLAERVAVFLEKAPDKRMELYRQIKQAYNLRSKIIHGAKVKTEFADLTRLCSMLDDLVRRVLNRVVVEVELQNLFEMQEQDVFEKRFLEMLF